MFESLKSAGFDVFDFVCDKGLIIAEKLHLKPVIGAVTAVAKTLQIPLIINTIVGLFIKDPMINLEYTAVKTAVEIAIQHRHNQTVPM